MPLFNLTLSSQSHFSTSALQDFPTKVNNFPFPSTSAPVSTLNFSPFSKRLLRNGIWVSQRNRFHAKSADAEPNTNEPSTQSSVGNVTVSSSGGNSSTSFLSLLCPLLKLFSGGDPSRERNYSLEVATSLMSTLARFPWGSNALSESSQSQEILSADPPMHLQLFEFEACPFCRRVREAMTELDLSVEVYPCPKGSVRHREMVRTSGGKEQFPFLIDLNTGISLYESGDIVNYLFQQYGKGRSPSTGLLESTFFTGWMPTILRAGRGMTLWEKARQDPPPKKLELFSYENNPYARIVREALCELELPYLLHNVGEGSRRAKTLLDVSGSKEYLCCHHEVAILAIYFYLNSAADAPWQVPYFIDPNTGARFGDYKRILSYLFQTYSAANV